MNEIIIYVLAGIGSLTVFSMVVTGLVILKLWFDLKRCERMHEDEKKEHQ